MSHVAKTELKLIGRQLAVNSGVVYYKPAKIGLQGTRKYWCELYRESCYHPRQLQLVGMPRSSNTEAPEIVLLENVFKIVMHEGSVKGKFFFHIMTSKGKVSFGTDSFEETVSWVNTLNEELFGPPKHGVVYEYRVKVEKTYTGESSYGNYLLRVLSEEIRLFTSNGLIPTKFNCPMKDIHKVKYHAIGPLNCCVTISVKNAQTRYKAKDVLILNTKRASDIAKVINYRKKQLCLDEESDKEPVVGDKDVDLLIKKLQNSSDELKQSFLDRKTLGATGTTSTTTTKGVLRRQKKLTYHDDFGVEETSSTRPVARPDYTQSLPRCFNNHLDPSIDGDDGGLLSESFNIRAPKRQINIKKKQQELAAADVTNSRRPLTSAMLNNDACYVSVDKSPFTTQYSTDITESEGYDYVRRIIPRHKSAGAAVTTAIQKKLSDDGYVISSLEEANEYVQMLSPDKDYYLFAFIPDQKER